jgi:hypothetical protein
MTGQYDYYLFSGDGPQPSSRNAFNGTFSGVAGFNGKVTLTLTGTRTYDKFNYEMDEEGVLLYELGIEETETTSSTAEATFTITGADATPSESATVETQREDSNLRIKEIATKSGNVYIK